MVQERQADADDGIAAAVREQVDPEQAAVVHPPEQERFRGCTDASNHEHQADEPQDGRGAVDAEQCGRQRRGQPDTHADGGPARHRQNEGGADVPGGDFRALNQGGAGADLGDSRAEVHHQRRNGEHAESVDRQQARERDLHADLQHQLRRFRQQPPGKGVDCPLRHRGAVCG